MTMISANEARELSDRAKEYKDVLETTINCISRGIRKQAMFGNNVFSFGISEESLCMDVKNILKKNGYRTSIIRSFLPEFKNMIRLDIEW